jgi:hypothetical protein
MATGKGAMGVLPGLALPICGLLLRSMVWSGSELISSPEMGLLTMIN